MQTFFKMGNFKRPSLTHGTNQGHEIFTFAEQIGLLIDYQVFCRSRYNWEILRAKFRKIAKNCQSLGSPNSS